MKSVAWEADAPQAYSPDRDFVLGIDFGGTKMAIATASLDGEPLEYARLETEATRGARQAVARALERARDSSPSPSSRGTGAAWPSVPSAQGSSTRTVFCWLRT